MEENEIDLRHYLFVLKKRWKIVVLITFVATLASVIITLILPRLYESRAILKPAYVGKTIIDKSGIARLDKEVVESIEATRLLLKNPANPYVREIAQKLYDSEEKWPIVLNNFELTEKAGFIHIVAKERSPEKAMQFVNLLCEIVANRYNTLLEKEKNILNAEILALKNQLKKAEKAQSEHGTIFTELKSKEISLEHYTKPTEIAASASRLETPIYPKRKKIVMITFVLSFVFSIFCAFLVEFLSKTELTK